MQHTFWYISLLLLCAITTWNFQKLPSYTFYGGTVVCVPVPFFSLPLTFTLVAASTSHFLTTAINFHVILPTNLNWSPFNNLFFIFCPSSFFVIYINVDIKIKLKERISFVVVFLPLKAWVATQFIAKTLKRYLKCIILPQLSWRGGRTYGRRDNFLRTKICWMHR